MAIQARKVACRKLREARRTVKQDETLREKWNTYKNKRRFVKKLIRKEKKEMRKRTLRKIKEQGGAKLQAILVRPERRASKQEEKHSKIEEQEWKDHR